MRSHTRTLTMLYVFNALAALVIVGLLSLALVHMVRLSAEVKGQVAFETMNVLEHREVSRCAFHENAVAQRAILRSLLDLAKQVESLDPGGIREALRTLEPPANIDGLDCGELMRVPPVNMGEGDGDGR